MARDWGKIQAEYIAGNISYKKLAEKHEVSESALTERTVAENWCQQRKDYRSKTVVKSLDLCSDRRAAQMARIDGLAVRLLDKVEQAVNELGSVHTEEDQYSACRTASCLQSQNALSLRLPIDARELKRLAETLNGPQKSYGHTDGSGPPGAGS